MTELIYIFSSILFAIVFVMLGFFAIFLHIPKEEGYKYYRYSRYTLGTAFFIASLYCCVRHLLDKTGEFTSFSFLAIFALLFSWMTYMSFLLIIYAERFKRKRFFLDGAIPAAMMLISALIGLKFPHLQKINSITFGIIFGLKCAWMAYTCLKEYRNCVHNLNNYYDNAPDISWMKSLLVVTFALSVMTIVYFYVPQTYFIYYPLLLATYFFMTFRIINYLPVKISRLRKESVTESSEKEEKKISLDIKQKIGHLVEKWENEKGYLKPEITIKDVALEIGTNHNYLSKYINSELGMTFTVYLHTLRINESKELLMQAEKISIEEVGKRVGIPESYNFSRWFKTVTGMTPQQFRKAHKQK